MVGLLHIREDKSKDKFYWISLESESTISVKTLIFVSIPNFKLRLICFYSNLSKCGIRVNEAQ